MRELWVGLAGVVVGGFLTLISNFALERHRETRLVEREGSRDERELRRAARLVHDELREALWLIEHAVDHYEWWPYPSRKFAMRRWDEFAPSFAGSNEVADDQWSSLSFAYEDLRSREAGLNASYRRSHSLPPFDAEVDQDLRWLWNSVNEGRESIAELAGQRLERNGFDGVAALFHAAEAAARQLLSDAPVLANPPPKDRAPLEATADVTVLGVAILRAPSWVHFEAEIPKGTVLTTTVPEIADVAACIACLLGKRDRDSKAAVSLVPAEVRDLPEFDDFAFVIEDRKRVDFFRETPAS